MVELRCIFRELFTLKLTFLVKSMTNSMPYNLKKWEHRSAVYVE